MTIWEPPILIGEDLQKYDKGLAVYRLMRQLGGISFNDIIYLSNKRDAVSILYVALSLKEKDRSRIVGYTPDDIIEPYPIPASINVSLSDILSNVNTADTNLLKYIPNGFLDKTQKEAKQTAIKETEEYIDKKNKQRMAKSDKTPTGDGTFSEPAIDCHNSDYDIVFILRKQQQQKHRPEGRH